MAKTRIASNDGEPVTAEHLKAAGAMTVLLKDAIKPNLVQTLEGQPALLHCGPFANIAHGNNSLVADRVALKLGDYVVTESGFGSDMGMEKFLEKIATRIYGADGVVFQPRAQAAIGRFTEQGYGRMRVCMAKTHLSLSHDATLLNAPGGFTVPVRDIRAYTGAGWLVALCGEMMTMPGLGATPAAAHVDIDEQGRTVGLF